VEQFQWETIPGALTSYKGVLGDARLGGLQSQHDGTLPDYHNVSRCNGVFYRVTYRESVSLANITDGLSNTFLIGEDVPQHNAHSAAFYSNGDYASCHARNFYPEPARPRLVGCYVIPVGTRRRDFARADGSVQFILNICAPCLPR
jgi:hypothetical protein